MDWAARLSELLQPTQNWFDQNFPMGPAQNTIGPTPPNWMQRQTGALNDLYQQSSGFDLGLGRGPIGLGNPLEGGFADQYRKSMEAESAARASDMSPRDKLLAILMAKTTNPAAQIILPANLSIKDFSAQLLQNLQNAGVDAKLNESANTLSKYIHAGRRGEYGWDIGPVTARISDHSSTTAPVNFLTNAEGQIEASPADAAARILKLIEEWGK